jgi:hypothetical protein
MEILQTLKEALVSVDNDRPRSTQKRIGASSIGGCRTAAWHIINNTDATNHDTELLAAIIGTATHAAIAEAMAKADIFGDEFLIEFSLKTEDLRGHADLLWLKEKMIVDWKTTTLKGLARFPTPQQKMQVNLYAYMALANGYEVEKVCLVAIPRDGKMSDIIKWEADYNPAMAEKGLAWLKEVQDMETAPPAERSARFFCNSYCKFYDQTGEKGCQGK